MTRGPSRCRLFAALLGPLLLSGCPDPAMDTGALVLVNSRSADYEAFGDRIVPYLDNFGVPYAVLDVARGDVTPDVERFAVLLVGHAELDPDGMHLSPLEHEIIVGAVRNGVGLVNFDNRLADPGGAAKYPFVEDLFRFGYGGAVTGAGVDFLPAGTVFIPCWDDGHQDPVLPTTTDASALDPSDGAWTEFHYVAGGRPFPSVFAGVDESGFGLPVMRFHADGIENGTYEVRANLYRAGAGHELRYYYGFTEDTYASDFVDAAGGSVGPDQHVEYSLGTVEIPDGAFQLYVREADLLSGAYPFFGWAWITLSPVGAAGLEAHYITARHVSGERVHTGQMRLAGIASSGAPDARVLATSGEQPFLVAAECGKGRAVQWASTDWTAHSVKGPVAGLDDLVWRSVVWAARKPFVMRCLPPFVTMRVDDVSGPFVWAEIAAAHGLIPWMGVFLDDMDEAESAHLSTLAARGLATVSVHAFSYNDFFFYDHAAARNRPDEAVAASFDAATRWHQEHGIPVSSYVLPHFYELGTNVFQGLADWGVEFVGTHMLPGAPYATATAWLAGGPYRLYDPPMSCRAARPVFYADFLSIPGRPEFDGRFFNCVTEIRDDAGYEWYPGTDVAGSIGRGVRQTVRALDSKVLATLFTHEQFVQAIPPADWERIIQGVVEGLAPFRPRYVSLDDAVRHRRALRTSTVHASRHLPGAGQIHLRLTGQSDVETSVTVYVDSGEGAGILEAEYPLPAFQGDLAAKIPVRSTNEGGPSGRFTSGH